MPTFRDITKHSVTIEFEMKEIHILLNAIFAAKFGEGPRPEIFTHEFVNNLCIDLSKILRSSGSEYGNLPTSIPIFDNDGVSPASSLLYILNYIDEKSKDFSKNEVDQILFPYNDNRSA